MQFGAKKTDIIYNNKIIIPNKIDQLSNGVLGKWLHYPNRPSNIDNYLELFHKFPNKIDQLSNGVLGKWLHYPNRPSNIDNYLELFHKFPNKNFNGQQTDLFCIHNSVAEKIIPLLLEFKKINIH